MPALDIKIGLPGGDGVIDLVEEYGADNTGVVAIDTVLDLALARLNNHTGIWSGRPTRLYLRPGVYKVALPHVWEAPMGCEFIGAGKWSTKLVWAGEAGQPAHMLTLRNARSVKIGHMDLDSDGLITSSVAGDSSLLRIHRDTDLDIYSPTSVIVEQLICREGVVGGDYILIDGDPFHNDYPRFIQIELEGIAGQRSGVCIDSQQQKGAVFEQCKIGMCGRGVYAPNQNGSFTWHDGFMYFNDIADFDLDSVTDPVIIDGAFRSEGSRRFIINSSNSSNGWPLNVRGVTWTSENIDADGRFVILGRAGPHIFEGCSFGGPASPLFAPVHFYVTNTGISELVIRHCKFDAPDSLDVHPVELIEGHNCKVTRYGNIYRTGGASNLLGRRTDEPQPDVHGPDTSTDEGLARFDSTTGKILQSSLVTLSDDGTVLRMPDAGGVHFGVSTSARPKLKRNGAALQCQLGDDSGPAQFVCKDVLGFNTSSAETIRLSGAAGQILLQASGQLRWPSGAIGTTVDTAITRNSAISTLLVTDGSTGVGAVNHSTRVLPKVGAHTAALTEALSVFTNEGTTGRVDISLPTAVANLTYTAYCHDTDGIRVIAATGDTIRIAASISAAGGRADCTTIGSSITFLAINATEWVATAIVGDGWTVT